MERLFQQEHKKLQQVYLLCRAEIDALVGPTAYHSHFSIIGWNRKGRADQR